MNRHTARGTEHQLVTAALDYASRGWHVFPLRPGDKRPATPTHPRSRCDRSDRYCQDGHTGWQERATIDPTRITRAWSSRPYGIGIATGPSGLLVLDTDVPKLDQPRPPATPSAGHRNGEDSLAALCSAPVPPTYTVRTRSGGTHRYYLAPPDRPDAAPLGNTAGVLGWLIDTRAAGGYVVAPPTVINGGAYTVVDDRSPVPLPRWLALGLAERRPREAAEPRARSRPVRTSSRYVAAAVAGETHRVSIATAGRRNHALFVAAVALGQLVGSNSLDEAVAARALLDAAAGHVDDGAFTAGQATATVRSGLDRGRTEPRQVRAA